MRCIAHAGQKIESAVLNIIVTPCRIVYVRALNWQKLSHKFTFLSTQARLVTPAARIDFSH